MKSIENDISQGMAKIGYDAAFTRIDAGYSVQSGAYANGYQPPSEKVCTLTVKLKKKS